MKLFPKLCGYYLIFCGVSKHIFRNKRLVHVLKISHLSQWYTRTVNTHPPSIDPNMIWIILVFIVQFCSSYFFRCQVPFVLSKSESILNSRFRHRIRRKKLWMPVNRSFHSNLYHDEVLKYSVLLAFEALFWK